MQRIPIVRYRGVFTDAQKQAIGRAATRIEIQCNVAPVQAERGARWLAVAREVSRGRRLFIASRIGEEEVIAGETVSELIGQLRKAFADRRSSTEQGV